MKFSTKLEIILSWFIGGACISVAVAASSSIWYYGVCCFDIFLLIYCFILAIINS